MLLLLRKKLHPNNKTFDEGESISIAGLLDHGNSTAQQLMGLVQSVEIHIERCKRRGNSDECKIITIAGTTHDAECVPVVFLRFREPCLAIMSHSKNKICKAARDRRFARVPP